MKAGKHPVYGYNAKRGKERSRYHIPPDTEYEEEYRPVTNLLQKQSIKDDEKAKAGEVRRRREDMNREMWWKNTGEEIASGKYSKKGKK
jgi:hypothetical protein